MVEYKSKIRWIDMEIDVRRAEQQQQQKARSRTLTRLLNSRRAASELAGLAIGKTERK